MIKRKKRHYLFFFFRIEWFFKEQTWSPSTRNTFCSIWLKLAKWLWKRIFFVNFIYMYVFSLFRNYLPLENSGVLQLNKFESRSPKDALCQVWLKLVQWFLRRWKCENFMITTTKTTITTTINNGQILIR